MVGGEPPPGGGHRQKLAKGQDKLANCGCDRRTNSSCPHYQYYLSVLLHRRDTLIYRSLFLPYLKIIIHLQPATHRTSRIITAHISITADHVLCPSPFFCQRNIHYPLLSILPTFTYVVSAFNQLSNYPLQQ